MKEIRNCFFIVLYKDKRMNEVLLHISDITTTKSNSKKCYAPYRLRMFQPLYTGFSSRLLLINYKAFNLYFIRNLRIIVFCY